MTRYVVLGLVALAGCRIHFDPLTDDGGASPNDAHDAAQDVPIDVCASALVCDDFEGGITMPSGAAMLDPTGGRDGSAAFRVQASANEASYVRYALPATVTTGTLYARAHVKVATGAPIQTFAVLIQLDNGVETSGLEKVSADITTDDHFSIAAPFSDAGAIATTTITRDQWFCLELVVDVAAGPTGSISLAIAGTEVVANGPEVTMPPGGFQRVTIGLSMSGDESQTMAWFDDFVVSTAIAGC